MKVIFYCSKFPPQAGGAGIDAFHLGKDLSDEKYVVNVVCEHVSGEKKYEQLNENYFVYRVRVPFIKSRSSGLYFIALNFSIAIKGISLIFRENSDILHCHDTATGIAGLITKMITNKPTVFKFGGSLTYEYLCNTYKNGWDPIVGESWVWEHGNGIAKILLMIEKQFYKRFDRIYPITQYLVNILHKYLSINSKKIRLIHNGVDTNILNKVHFKDIKKELKINKLIFTGVRFVKYKGVHILIEACKNILEKFDAHLFIAGSGPEKYLLEKIAENNPRIIFVGNLSWEQNLRYVRSADVYVLSSLVDKVPSALMEALALEVPCIASNISGIRELITSGGGILVDPNNPEALKEKIVWIFEHPKQAEFMGKVGRKFIASEFHWRKTRENIKQLYQELMIADIK